MKKALPKKEKEVPVRKVPVRGAVKKVPGKSGKTRYTYPAESVAKKAVGDVQMLPVDLAKFCTQIGERPEAIRRIAKRFQANAKGLLEPSGKAGFVAFMGSRLKEVNAKHALSPAYYEKLYDAALSGA